LAARAEGHALMARFTLYTPLIADLILEELCSGRSLSDICGDPAMPSIRTVNQWALEDREGFKERYRDARDIGCYTLAYQVLDIADDSRHDRTLRRSKDGTTEFAIDQGNIKRSQLRVNAREWLLAKLLPKRFGDRPDPKPDAGADFAEVMKLVDGRTRGLPSEGLPPLDGFE